MSHPEKLAAYVRMHGCPCRVTSSGLRAASREFSMLGSTWRVTDLPATFAAVREWLGY